ncbi:MAG: pacearchaeosortase [Nanoarchaeota archaeon]|nr:pacearchaeosortase [Nanoarchaeota archaeon]
MNNQSKKIIGLFARYLSLLLLGANLYFFRDKILTPLTIKASSGILSIFSPTTVADNIIRFKGIMIEIIPACVAASAFFLLLFLILSATEIKPGKRALIIILSTLTLFIINILRIVLLAGLARTSFFQLAHLFFWHLISTIFVVGIWFSMVKIFKIKSIPVYSDIMYFRSLIKPRKKSKRSKKHK